MNEMNNYGNNSLADNGESQFYGKVPKPLELAFVGACLGAPIQYRKEKTTGLDQVCMLIPNKGGFQPVMVTLGKENSIGKGAHEAVYHQLNLEKLLNVKITDKEGNRVLVKAFNNSVGYSLRRGVGSNGYTQKIMNPRFDELDERVKDIYPECYQLYRKEKEAYLDEFRAFYSDKSKSDNTEQLM